MKAAPGLHVCSPALTLAQLGNTLPFASLYKAALWLCGIFAFEPLSDALVRCEPLTTVASAKRYLEKAVGVHGAKAARTVLGRAQGRCASPRESDLAALLLLPKMRGGYGLKGAVLNYQVEAPANLRRKAGQGRFECDMFWAAARLDLEYDSDTFHADAPRKAHDFRRDTALALLGIDVVHVTNTQIQSADALNAVAEEVGAKLGLRARPERPAESLRRGALRYELLGDGAWEGFRRQGTV